MNRRIRTSTPPRAHHLTLSHTERARRFHVLQLPPSFQPHDPLHTQWLSSTLTPFEYQHLVDRSTQHRQQEDDNSPPDHDPDWWLRVASEIEDDFLYRHLAPCGAD